MASRRKLLGHPSYAMEEASDALRHYARAAARRPSGVAGVLLLILAVVGFIYLFPELHREARLMRM